ncbi:MAG: hypothetical protein HIU84_13565, partial [Acidobacteria bacterium]|nr:hypothetical protein [Acidobacteriota bacterium]
MKTMTSSRGGYRSVRSVLRSAIALGAASTLLATGMMFVAASPASAASPPTVTTVSPNAGPTIGNTSVTITGTGFDVAGTTYTVDFGGNPATNVVVNSTTSITATSPAGAGPGTVDVTVTNPQGQSARSVADHFTYGGPTVTAVSPNVGPTTGGTSVTITGTGFVVGTTTVAFGGN